MTRVVSRSVQLLGRLIIPPNSHSQCSSFVSLKCEYSSSTVSSEKNRNPSFVSALNIPTSDVNNNASLEEFNNHGPLDLYLMKVKCKELNEDTRQKQVVERLQALHEELKTYRPQGKQVASWFKRFSKKQATMKGLYIYGNVGTGKTMLMDMFHNTSSVIRKQRVHFHKFMLDVHKRIHALKQSQPKLTTTRGSQPFDPIGPIALQISEEAWLLCFDEFQVTDVADAMILKRLFAELFENGVIVVATSNRTPDDLYKNGLQRANFLPCISMLKKHCEVVSLDSGIDYRMNTLPSEGQTYFIGLPEETDPHIDSIIKEFVDKQRIEMTQRTLIVLGRNLHLPVTYGRVLDTSFDSMCKKNLGAIDYLELCKEFDFIVLRSVPRMNLNNRTEARRFITFIDTIYDNKVKLVISAASAAKDVFSAGDIGSSHSEDNRALMDDLGINLKSELAKSSIFTGEDEIFAFKRIISRLTEMQSKEYWQFDRSQVVKPPALNSDSTADLV